jgi:ATP-dependent Lon protease
MDDLNKWFNSVKKNNKRKRDVNYDGAINDLKYLAFESIEDFVKISDPKTKRQITNTLNNLQIVFNESKKLFTEIANDDEVKLTLNAFTIILNEIIKDMKLDIYAIDDFNYKKYIKNKKSFFNKKRAKFIKDVGISLDIIEDIKDMEESDIYEEYEEIDNEVTEYESTDSESSEEKEDNMSEDKIILKSFQDELMNSNSSSNDIMEYFSSLDNSYKKELIEKFKDINNINNNNEPSLIKILNMNTSLEVKKILISKMNNLNSGLMDKSKLKNWFNNAMKIPFGQYKGVDISTLCKKGKSKKITKFLNKLKIDMDNAIYGHDKAKEQVMIMMAQQIRNPNCKGNIFGIWGPPGNGKTSLIKEGIAKAMKKPFVFISLGGATDASYLEGHSFTYEGSIYGRIVQGLIKSKCMDPIIYFDELDKVSSTPKGDEIINLLIHMIDPSQNSHFKDKYFYDLDIDLSKVTFIFSFNEPQNVNYILMDRITSIETKYLTTEQKKVIGKEYLLPSILSDVGLKKNSIIFNDLIMEHIVLKYTYEGGVRKLKQLLYEIVRKLNSYNLTENKININFPYDIKLEDLDLLLKDYRKISRDKIHNSPQIGMVNGLWANSMGIGGVLPIESSFIPSKEFMNVKATGSLKNVMKESIQVALSVAWNYVDDNIKKNFLEKWEKKPETFHIHCPDGAVPKDGPSAGAAMTLVMYSQLVGLNINNKVAMTGEINLRGNITAIGGLEEKLVGAKLAGVELALIPEENREDLEKILSRIPNLVDDTFRVEIISHFSQIPDLVK